MNEIAAQSGIKVRTNGIFHLQSGLNFTVKSIKCSYNHSNNASIYPKVIP